MAKAASTPPPPSHNIGSRMGGLSNLTEGGSQLRRIGDLAGPAFVAAMESISPGEPELVFQQLMKKPSFRNRFLTDFQRQIFSPTAVRDRLLEINPETVATCASCSARINPRLPSVTTIETADNVNLQAVVARFARGQRLLPRRRPVYAVVCCPWGRKQ